MLIKILQSIVNFIIYIFKGFLAFLTEFIPLLFKAILLISPFFLLIYCSYIFGGLKIAVPSTVFVVGFIIIGLVWARKQNITDKTLSAGLIFFILFLDAGFIVSSVMYAGKINLKPRNYTEKAKNGEKIEIPVAVIIPRQENSRELRIRTFLDSLRQSVSDTNEYSWDVNDFLHAMENLKEMKAYNEVPISLIVNVLNKSYSHVDEKKWRSEEYDFPTCDKYRKICQVCIDFFVVLKAKEACKLLYKIQTKEGYLYEIAKSASLNICGQ